ncbi:hypothetical protein GCM10011487_62940 [Steroidobacter agaridevorans]|uniref:Uncharacterized protein n=1 Tax=Steroidobacter agaridevorans TaxID=2695856 RepID=A0A829YLI6_9GAMM|nr:hypothetical protein [Steroidobacter agaridevorans]GFE84294.1 hypothetical protein GCM10011487_62940 [Steroidobacter agaridevorans]
MEIFHGHKLLAAYAGVLTVGVTAALLSGFTGDNMNPRFDTISVQRINVVEPDGKIRMVLTNNNRIPGLIINGHEYADYGNRKASTAAGMLFYDAQATESGGLTFGGLKNAQGQISRFGHFSFDRYNQDQMLTISAADDGTNHRAEIKMIDQPSWPIEEYLDLLDSIQHLPPAEQEQAIAEFFQTHPPGAGLRTLLGTQTYPTLPAESRNTLNLRDDQGRERARLTVAADGTPSLEFLDAAGNVTHRYPPN